MPTIRQLSKLFQAVSVKDFHSAEQIAKQMASFEERKGHHSAAQLLRGSLQSNGIKGHRAIEPLSGILTNGNFIDAALSRGRNSTQLKDVMLLSRNRERLQGLIRETRHAAYLTSKG